MLVDKERCLTCPGFDKTKGECNIYAPIAPCMKQFFKPKGLPENPYRDKTVKFVDNQANFDAYWAYEEAQMDMVKMGWISPEDEEDLRNKNKVLLSTIASLMDKIKELEKKQMET